MSQLKYSQEEWEVNWDFLEEHFVEIIESKTVFPMRWLRFKIDIQAEQYLFKRMKEDKEIGDIYYAFRLDKYKKPGETEGQMNWRLFSEFVDKHPEFSGLIIHKGEK